MQCAPSVRGSEHIVKTGYSAERFFLSRFWFVHSMLDYKVSKANVMAAIVAGSWEMVHQEAKKLLRHGINAYLHEQGFETRDPAYLRLNSLAEALHDKPDLYEEARELELLNPEYPQQIKAYAFRCIAFIEAGLDLIKYWDQAGGGTEINWDNFYSWTINLTQVLEKLGRPGIFSTSDYQELFNLTRKL